MVGILPCPCVCGFGVVPYARADGATGCRLMACDTHRKWTEDQRRALREKGVHVDDDGEPLCRSERASTRLEGLGRICNRQLCPPAGIVWKTGKFSKAEDQRLVSNIERWCQVWQMPRSVLGLSSLVLQSPAWPSSTHHSKKDRNEL